MIAMCEHGIIYYCKSLRKGESPRDHLDACDCVERQPIVCISDQAPALGGLAPTYHQSAPVRFQKGAAYELSGRNARKCRDGRLEKVRLKKQLGLSL